MLGPTLSVEKTDPIPVLMELLIRQRVAREKTVPKQIKYIETCSTKNTKQ